MRCKLKNLDIVDLMIILYLILMFSFFVSQLPTVRHGIQIVHGLVDISRID